MLLNTNVCSISDMYFFRWGNQVVGINSYELKSESLKDKVQLKKNLCPIRVEALTFSAKDVFILN